MKMKCNVTVKTVKLNNKQRKAMTEEINKRIFERSDSFKRDLESMILYTLHDVFGFGVGRLEKFYAEFSRLYDELKERYEMDDAYPAYQKLLDMGLDVEELQRKYD